MKKYVSYQQLRNVPLRLLRGRLDFIRRLEHIYSEAMREREQYCDEHGITWRVAHFSEKSADEIHDKLFKLWLDCHVEYITRRVNISKLENEATKLSNHEFYGYEYNGAVSDLTH